MPNLIDENGLQTATREELETAYITGMQAIYGANINLEQDSPDGQQMGLIIQMVLDQLDLIRRVYNSFDPEEAIGSTLDKRVAYNGIQRNGGTYSFVEVEIVTSQRVQLLGLNQVGVDNAYTLEDSEGNKWVLDTNATFTGTNLLNFRALEIGNVTALPDTITVQDTIILGVDSVTNPTVPYILGEDQESDVDLKIRRQKSVSINSSGYLASLYAELEEIQGVSEVLIKENKNDFVDSDGLLPHSIAVVLSGSYDQQEVAEAIYRKRNAGCNMNGTILYNVSQVDGTLFEIRWNDSGTEDLYVQMTLDSIDGVNPPLVGAVKSQLHTILSLGIDESVNVNTITELVKQIDPNAVVASIGLSLNGVAYSYKVEPASFTNQLVLTEARTAVTAV